MKMAVSGDFFEIPLKHVVYRFSGSVNLLALSVSMCDTNSGCSGHVYFIIDLRLLA